MVSNLHFLDLNKNYTCEFIIKSALFLVNFHNIKHRRARAKKNNSSWSCFSVRMKGVEPPRLAALDPKSSVSTNSTTSAAKWIANI